MAFTKKVLAQTVKRETVDITSVIHDSKEVRKLIDKVFQQANRRIQNIKQAGLASPALKKLFSEYGNIQRYSFFSRTGRDLKDNIDFEIVRYDFERAQAFLAEPTSTALGTRQYIKGIANDFGIDDLDFINQIVDKVTTPEISAQGDLEWIKYHSIIEYTRDEIKADFVNNPNMKNEYKEFIEQKLREATERIVNEKSYLKFLGRGKK